VSGVALNWSCGVRRGSAVYSSGRVVVVDAALARQEIQSTASAGVMGTRSLERGSARAVCVHGALRLWLSAS
jgi:hypothetical protein